MLLTSYWAQDSLPQERIIWCRMSIVRLLTEPATNSELITPPFVSHGKDGHGLAVDLVVFYPPITALVGSVC